MNKIYIKPISKCIKLNNEEIIATSGDGFMEKSDGPASHGSEVLSKDRSGSNKFDMDL